MIRDEEFRISRRPYAVDLTSYTVSTQEYEHGTSHSVGVCAAWFRRRRGLTVACVGEFHGWLRGDKPADVHEALVRMDDGRYGGRCFGRWDGTGYWAGHAGSPAVTARHLELLRPMLENYPAVPPGYDGWYRFEDGAS